MKFKYSRDNKRFFRMHPLLMLIAVEMNLYCFEQNVEMKITSTMSTLDEDVKVKRTSRTHREGRAFDISLKKWQPEFIESFVSQFNEKYLKYGAVTHGGSRVLIHRHIGTADHLHVQIDRNFYLKTLKER